MSVVAGAGPSPADGFCRNRRGRGAETYALGARISRRPHCRCRSMTSLVNLGMGMAVTVEIRPASQRAQLSALADPPDDRRKGFDTRELKQAIEYVRVSTKRGEALHGTSRSWIGHLPRLCNASFEVNLRCCISVPP